MGVVESPHRELELIGMADKRLQVGYRVTVRIKMDLPPQQRAHRLPPDLGRQVPLHSLQAPCRRRVAPVVLLAHQRYRLLKGVPELPALAQTARRSMLAGAAVHALRIL